MCEIRGLFSFMLITFYYRTTKKHFCRHSATWIMNLYWQLIYEIPGAKMSGFRLRLCLFTLLREKSNLGKIREKRVISSLWYHQFLSIDFICLGRYISHKKYFFVVNDDLSWRTKKDNVRNIHWIPIKTDLGVGRHKHKRNIPRFYT